MGWVNNINSAFDVNYTYFGPGQFKGKGFENAVLADYTDACGSFGISVNIYEPLHVDVSWGFWQSFEKPYLDYMCEVLGVGRVMPRYESKKTISFGDSTNAWLLTTNKKSDLIILDSYFSKYPLHTVKASTRYLHWKQVLQWKLQGPYVVRENLLTILEFQRINSLLT